MRRGEGGGILALPYYSHRGLCASMGALRRVRSVCVSLSAFSILSLILIARRHAVHRERDVVMANTSVRLSACPSYSGVVSKPMHISSIQTLSAFWYGNDTSLFERYRSYKIPTGTPSATALNTLRWDFLAIFDRSRRLPLKRYETDPWLLITIDR